MSTLEELCSGLPLSPLPSPKNRSDKLGHAPIRQHNLDEEGKLLAVENALRYFPKRLHPILQQEFLDELNSFGHIYMYRFLPNIQMKAYPINEYPCKIIKAGAIMLMIMNNLDPDVAQFPEELVTYGGNGQVFSNWAQFWIVMNYLANMTEEQTLVMYSGHPMGLFPSREFSPRMVITNGMVIPQYSTKDDYNDMFALGVSIYGQMTAGSYCYIGPQGIIHGTLLTIVNGARLYLKSDHLSGKVFLSSGLGGMSGAQAKAAVISGSIGVIAEVNQEALQKRLAQNWIMEVISDLDHLIKRIREARKRKEAVSIGFHGNVVTVWERLVKEYESTGELLVDLASDQTSCHNPFNGGYYPVDISYDDCQKLMKSDPEFFKEQVINTLKRHAIAINFLCEKGAKFWDYGNAFLLEANRAGADVGAEQTKKGFRFKYPSYVQDIMGKIFSLGFGPFRWVCTSGLDEDLYETDNIATRTLEEIMKEELDEEIRKFYKDNIEWIKSAKNHNLVVGSKARILYSDQIGRMKLAEAFNEAIKNGSIKGPIILSRDHHDVSGTDSPFRETSNIWDGSSFTADMATQNWIGDAIRGATWVALHNGGGVGWGEAVNGGFGLLLDGSQEAGENATSVLAWDVSNGLARRAWSGNQFARECIIKAMKMNRNLKITLSHT